MHTDDDLFENLNIEENGRDSAGNRQDRGADDLFEDLDMEDRIYETAFREDSSAAQPGYGTPQGNEAGSGRDRSRRADVSDYLARRKESVAGRRAGNAGTEKQASREAGPQAGRKPVPAGRPGAAAGSRPGTRRSPRELNTVDSSVDRREITREKETRKKSRVRKIVLFGLLEIVTLAAIFAYGYFLRRWNMIARPEVRLDVIENNNISLEKKKEMEGYWNIAVFGVDSRTSNVVEKGLNSDVIMVASINKDTGDIRLVSVFRDTYLNISEKNSYNKINQAYAIGGPEQALAALNKNMDLNIQHYVAFNWKAVAEGINILGGVDDIPISKAELYYINAYITETVKVTKIGSYQLKNTGVQHLDGVQAVAYGRLRYMDNDFARTERQRNIIKAAFAKAKKASFSVLNNIMVVCFPQVATNIDFNEVISMAQNISHYNIGDTGGFPWSRGDANIGSKGDCVVPTTLESNVVKLHEFLFGDTNYTPSDAVLTISEKIKSDSRLYKEGKFIESVSTDGGVIQKPKAPAPAASAGSSSGSKESTGEDSGEDVTLGVDEDGNYIYPTDEDGNIIIPTDENGEVIYPTDEDGNIIRESARPTELSSEDGVPGGASLAPGETDDGSLGPGGTPGSSVNTNPTRETRNTGGNAPLDPAEENAGGPDTDSGTSPTATANPISPSQTPIDGPIVSSGGPGSLGQSGSSASGGPGSETASGSSGSGSAGTASPGSTGTDSSQAGPSGSSGSGSSTADAPGGSTSGSASPGGSSAGTASPGSSSSGSASPGDSSSGPASPGGSSSGTASSPGTGDSPGGSTASSPSGGTASSDGPAAASPAAASPSDSSAAASPASPGGADLVQEAP